MKAPWTSSTSPGNPRFLLDNVRFASGESMRTGEDGKASVGLDDSKIVTLDADTDVEFIQEADHMRLNLREGSLFLDVQEKLDENAALDIQTSNLTVGIRGTMVFLSSHAGDDENPAATTLGVLEGTAQVTYTDSEGAKRQLPIPAGKKIVAPQLQGNPTGASPVLSPMTSEDIAGFVAETVAADPVLIERVTNGSENGAPLLEGTLTDDTEEEPFPADGDWLINSPVTIVAQSASKLYDGHPLTRSNAALVSGLPANFNIAVTCSGSVTDAGHADNLVSSYSISNSVGEDVTSHFTNISTVPGALVVDKAPITVWTGSAEKEYDGEPLTCEDAGIRTVSGYKPEDPAWKNTSLVTQTALGSEQMIAVSGVTYVHTSNPFTGKPQDVELTAGQRLSVSLQKGEKGESLKFVIEKLAEKDLPAEVLRLYAENPDLMAAACEEASWDPEVLKELIAALPEAQEQTVAVGGLKVAASDKDNLMKDSANVRITVDSQITNYNTRVLGSEEAAFTPIVLDPSITVTATGSQTEIGESENTYELKWGNANENNYIVKEDLGTLTVTQKTDSITITAPTAEKVYDGEPLEAGEAIITGLPKGYTVRATVTGSQTEAGESESKVTAYKIVDASGQDATYTFENVKLKTGKLTVKPLEVSINCSPSPVTFSGSEIIPVPVLSYTNGAHAGETVTASASSAAAGRNFLASAVPMTRPDTVKKSYRFVLFTGDVVSMTLSGMGSNAGSYTLTAEITSTTANISCPSTAIKGTTLTVQPASLVISTGSAEKTYDGEPLTCPDYTVEGLKEGDAVTITVTGTLTDPGTAENSFTVEWVSGNPDNYTVTSQPGTLTVKEAEATPTPTPTATPTPTPTPTPTATPTATPTPTPSPTDAPVIYLYAPSYTKEYDGELLVPDDDDIAIEGIPDNWTFMASCTGSQLNAGESPCTIDSYAIYDEGGNDVTALYTVYTEDGSLTVTPIVISISSPDQSKTYDDEPYPMCTDDLSTMQEIVSAIALGTEESGDVDAGTYENAISYTFNVDADKAANYKVELHPGTITINKANIDVWTTDDFRPYNGTPLICDDWGMTGETYGDDSYEIEFTHSQTDVGSTPASFNFTIYGNANNYNITTTFGTVTVTPKDLYIASEAKTKGYDGAPLTLSPEEVTISGLEGSDTATVTLTNNSITDPGSVTPTATVSFGSSTKADNYNIKSISLGDLTVTPNSTPITITAATTTHVYDGQEIQAMGGATIEGSLPSGFNFVVTCGGGGKDVGVYETNASYYITGPDGAIEDSWFPNVTVKKGAITITPCPVTFDLNYHTVVKGEGFIRPYPSCSIGTNSGDHPYDFTLSTGDTVTLNVGSDPAEDSPAGDYPISHSCTFTKGSVSNYSVSYINDTLSIVNPQIRFNLGGGTVDYTGNQQGFDFNAVTGTYTNGSAAGTAVSKENHTAVIGSAEYNFTVNGGSFHLTVTGGGTAPGDYPITYTVSEKTGNANYYVFSSTNDVLHIVASDPVSTDGSYNPDDPPHGYDPESTK